MGNLLEGKGLNLMHIPFSSESLLFGLKSQFCKTANSMFSAQVSANNKFEYKYFRVTFINKPICILHYIYGESDVLLALLHKVLNCYLIKFTDSRRTNKNQR